MKIKTTLLIVTLTTASLFLTSCQKDYVNSLVIDDLIKLKQNHEDYITGTNKNKPYIPKNYHKIIEKNYIKTFLRPWNTSRYSVKKGAVKNEFTRFKNKNGFGENKRQLSNEWINKLEKNAELSTYPNSVRNGITIANTNLRLLPTNKPHFTKFTDNSNGFPFDNLQNSLLAANTPIKINHISKDDAWVFVETPFAYGWVPIRDIAFAGPKFIKSFTKYKTYVAATDDDFPVKTFSGSYMFQGNIGMSFPLIKETKYNYHIATTMASSTRYAYVKEAVISKKYAARKPYALTTNNIAELCNILTNQPYGWGGLFDNRDCSAMIRDLFATFSIWLPRNSTSQAEKGGIYVDVEHLTNEEKEIFIAENGIPYLTLLWFPGHIMLYIGEKEGNPIVFHNIWGIRTKDEDKRKIIGKSVITTLKPGEELAEVDNTYNFLNRIKGMTLLVPRY